MPWFDILPMDDDTAIVRLWPDIGFGQTSDDFERELGDAPNVLIRIDSSGGCSHVGTKIHDILAARNTEAIIVRAYSSAVIVAQAAKKRSIFASGSMALHAASIAAFGDRTELRKKLSMLDRAEESIRRILAARTGQTNETIDAWLQPADRLFTPQQAWLSGLVDDIIPDVPEQMRPPALAITPEVSTDDDLLRRVLAAVGPVKTHDKNRLFRELSALVWPKHF